MDLINLVYRSLSSLAADGYSFKFPPPEFENLISSAALARILLQVPMIDLGRL
jgi:hypothetical protein